MDTERPTNDGYWVINHPNRRILKIICGFLTKCEVKMLNIGLVFYCVFVDRDGVHKLARKERG